MLRHVLDPGVWGSDAVESTSLESIHRLVWAEFTREVVKAEDIAEVPMDAEERRTRPAGLDHHERPAWRRVPIAPEDVGETLDGRRLHEGGQGQADAPPVLDLGEHAERWTRNSSRSPDTIG